MNPLIDDKSFDLSGVDDDDWGGGGGGGALGAPDGSKGGGGGGGGGDDGVIGGAAGGNNPWLFDCIDFLFSLIKLNELLLLLLIDAGDIGVGGGEFITTLLLTGVVSVRIFYVYCCYKKNTYFN